ncbi:MAG: hypothetical protein DYH13_03735 [Alphaproteobacteria bacterium PRO2]|nr:hypothetical protein [Alphaproteobacteria bacterium PRO2]
MPTPNLAIEYIAANQAQKEVTANAAFDALDKALCQLTSIAILDVDTTLTDAQMLGTLSMKFTGTLTAGRTITIPAKAKLLMVENNTTGGFTLSVKTPSGTAISMGVGDRKLLYCDGTTFQIVAETAVGAIVPYDIGGTLAGVPTGGSIVLRYPVPRAVRFPAGMAISQGVAGTASGATATFSIRKNGTQFATMQFAAGIGTATFTATTATDFAAGDVLTILAPSPADGTLADIGFSLAAIRL